LKDIVGAFVPFSASNTTIRSIFSYDSGLTKLIDKFPDILEQVLHLDEMIGDQDRKTIFVHDFLLPAYTQWKGHVDQILQEYVVN
jgi:hypothetical protein